MTKNDLDLHQETAERILEALDCPRALSVVILMRYGMWDEIANLQIDPLHYNDSEVFFRAYQSTRLLSKSQWLPTTIDRRAVAKRKFEEAEESCRRTNAIWGPYRRGELNFTRDYERIFFSARRKIGMVLGDALYRWTELCDFGPGADTATVHGMTSAYNKLCNPGSVTAGAYPYLEVFASLTRLGHCFTGNIATKRLDVEFSKGNRVTFVSKNAKTDRPIAVEPRWNIWMQKGLGRYLRYRLRFFGVDLDRQEPNQLRSREGSRTGKYGTIDLASASDTVSKELVQALLPEPWLTIFAALRSPSYTLDGVTREYEKWSSMGNGYTFELESLLFWAICSSVSEDVTVYGDDLVVPTYAFDKIVSALEVCGFGVNPSKSFKTGPFRESCGEDSFLGVRVTPIYWKAPLNTQGRLTLVNQVTTLARRMAPIGFRAKEFRSLWKRLVYQLPRQFQVRGPTTLSTVVHDSSAAWNAVRRFGWDGVWLNISLPVPRKHAFRDYNAAILSQFFQPCSHGYQIRDRVLWKKKTVFVPCGYVDIGPWI